MNSKQIQYAIKLSKIRNFSQVAEQLNITQPALSKQIMTLEKELGVKLFDRSNNPITLTPAGEHFIRSAAEILYREDQLLRSMEQFQTGESGQLVIGATPFRCAYMMPSIVKKVRDQYPGIQVHIHEVGIDILRAEVQEGKYDFAVVNLPVNESVLDVTPLEPDRLVLLVPDNLLGKLPVDSSAEEIDFAMCKDLPFAVVGPTQEMRIMLEKLCAAAGFYPNIAVEVVGLTTAWDMVRNGVGATLLPYQFVKHNLSGNNVHVFGIKNAVYSRQPAIVTRRGQHITAAAAYAIDLLTNTY